MTSRRSGASAAKEAPSGGRKPEQSSTVTPASAGVAVDSPLLVGLSPIIDDNIETLVLGSFPSPASLAAKQYYAHRQNQFWRVMAATLGEPLVEAEYTEKQRCLLRHHIGVWDVYRTCQREGALDSAIEAAEPNDFSTLARRAPRLRRIVFNGQMSGKFERIFTKLGYDTCVMPSTSPAYTLAFEHKLAKWRERLR